MENDGAELGGENEHTTVVECIKKKLTGVLNVLIHVQVFLFILWLMVLQLSFTCLLRTKKRKGNQSPVHF